MPGDQLELVPLVSPDDLATVGDGDVPPCIECRNSSLAHGGVLATEGARRVFLCGWCLGLSCDGPDAAREKVIAALNAEAAHVS